jgi:hypothetical protein
MNKVMIITILALFTSLASQAITLTSLSSLTASAQSKLSSLSASAQEQARNFAINQCKTNVIPAIKAALTCSNINFLMQKAGANSDTDCIPQAQNLLGLDAMMASVICSVAKSKAASICEQKLPALLDAQLPALCDQM